MDSNMRNRPLEINLHGGLLTISIGVSTLCYAIQQADEIQDVKIVNEDAFIKDFLVEMDREDEEGSTKLHKLFDELANQAINDGAFGVEVISDK